MSDSLVTHSGACHCGSVRFEAQAPAVIDATECNCSICSQTGFLHLIVPASRFRIVAGEDKLTTYQFNSRVARHTFCSTCGVKPFYVPRSNPDGWSVNIHCLDPSTIDRLEVTPFDGRHWEENAHTLRHLSKEETTEDAPR